MSQPAHITTAQHAFTAFQQGMMTGQWAAFLACISDDFTFEFPVGPFQGTNVGKARATEFFAYVAQVFPQGLRLTVQQVAWNDTTVIFEVLSEGEVAGKPYRNQAAIAFDVRDDLICGYREYLGILYQF